MSVGAPLSLSPIQLVVLQGTPFCNMNCSYCDLSVGSRRSKARMDLGLVERLFTELFRSGRLAPQFTVVWHSGEPLTLPPSYYDDAIECVLRLRDRIVGDKASVRFDFQTNGVLIDEAWCQFFLRHASLVDVGVSCDGTPAMHDRYRLDWRGRATASRTLRGMDLLQEHGIPYNIIAVVTDETLEQPDEFFGFFAERRQYLSGFHFNILASARSDGQGLAYSREDRARYYRFFRRLLQLSQEAAEAGLDFKIRNFSQTLARIVASQGENAPRYVQEASAPLRSISVDASGNLTTFYAGLSVETLPQLYGDGQGFSLGNINETAFEDMIRSEKLRSMMQDFARSTRFCESSCEYFQVCSGGFEITKRVQHGTFEAGETAECAIHVKTLVDAVLDDVSEHLARQSSPA